MSFHTFPGLCWRAPPPLALPPPHREVPLPLLPRPRPTWSPPRVSQRGEDQGQEETEAGERQQRRCFVLRGRGRRDKCEEARPQRGQHEDHQDEEGGCDGCRGWRIWDRWQRRRRGRGGGARGLLSVAVMSKADRERGEIFSKGNAFKREKKYPAFLLARGNSDTMVFRLVPSKQFFCIFRRCSNSKNRYVPINWFPQSVKCSWFLKNPGAQFDFSPLKWMWVRTHRNSI